MHTVVHLGTAASGTDEQVPGLLGVLAQVTDPRRERGRRFTLVFVLAVAVVCVLAGAKSFREIGGQGGRHEECMRLLSFPKASGPGSAGRAYRRLDPSGV